MTADDLWALPRVGTPAPSPDGRRVVVPVTTNELAGGPGLTRLWLMEVDGEEPRPLTPADRSSTQPAWSPDGKWLAFVRNDPEGQGQLHVLPVDGGEAEQMSDLPLGAADPRWLPDGSGLILVGTLLAGHLTVDATREERDRRQRDPVRAHVTEARVFRFWDTWLTTGEVPHLFHLDLSAGRPGRLRDLTPDSVAWLDWMEPAGQYDVSPDGREVAFAAIVFDEARSLLHSTLFGVSLAGGPVRALTPDHHADALRPRYSPDGRDLLYGRQEDPFFYADRVRLWRMDRSSGEHRAWLSDWDLSPAGWAFGGDGTLWLHAEEEARVSLFAISPSVAVPRRVVTGGDLEHPVPAADGAVLVVGSTLIDPPEVWRLPPGGESAIRLTRFTAGAAAAFGTGEVRERRFTGARGASVQMWLVLPPGDDGRQPAPLVHVIHGGPHGISGDGFHFRWNPHVFAAPGYRVALVNFQGSTSFGQDFAQRIQGAWGDRPFEDLMGATDVLVSDGVADPSRLAAAGGSYGGYLVAWIAGHTDRFRCLVNHAGVFDTLADYADDVTQGRGRAFGGEPWEDLGGLDRWNPARYTAAFRTPMLVLHGERDFRVPASLGLQCYGILKARGIPARLVYFPDEHHWILKPGNSRLWYREVLDWLTRWLGPVPSRTEP